MRAHASREHVSISSVVLTISTDLYFQKLSQNFILIPNYYCIYFKIISLIRYLLREG